MTAITQEQFMELYELKEDVILGRTMTNKSWDRLYYLQKMDMDKEQINDR